MVLASRFGRYGYRRLTIVPQQEAWQVNHKRVARVMRENDLIWSFHVNSYLLGKSPRAFDILYWNADSTNMPAAMHTFFMDDPTVRKLVRQFLQHGSFDGK